MKIQHLAIVFVVIMIPISFVLSTYVNSQITAITMQAQYDTRLYNATYDAVKAFQINTINNKFSSISDSKIRDIYAATNTFYNSLTSNFRKDGFTTEDLYTFTPAMVYTLYDGYYIYERYENTEKDIPEGAEIGEEYEYALKPMIYYSCRYYKENVYDIVVNYTLDNYITVVGTIGGETVTRSGYFINPEIINNSSDSALAGKLKSAYAAYQSNYDNPNWEIQQEYQLRRENRNFDTAMLAEFEYRDAGGNITPVTGMKLTLRSPNEEVTIAPEVLRENLLFAEGTSAEEYQYVIYKGQKYYLERDEGLVANERTRYFQYDSNYNKLYISPPSATNAKKDPQYWIWQYLEYCRDGQTLYSTTAMDYYLNAYIFSEWVTDTLKDVSVNNATGIVLERGGTEDAPTVQVKHTNIVDAFQTNLTQGEDQYIFRAGSKNDPEASASNFQEHRRNVIRYSIETSLKTAIANFNLYANAGYQYVLPVFNEEDWEKICNQICIVTFMQGMTVNKYKIYNNYCVLSNNKNKEFIGKNGIYLISQNGEYAGQKHEPGCIALMGDTTAGDLNVQGYNITDYLRQNVKEDENSTKFFYQHYEPSCYECIIGSNGLYEAEEILQGKIYKYQWGARTEEAEMVNQQNFKKIRTAYMTALAREKQSITKTMGYFGS